MAEPVRDPLDPTAPCLIGDHLESALAKEISPLQTRERRCRRKAAALLRRHQGSLELAAEFAHRGGALEEEHRIRVAMQVLFVVASDLNPNVYRFQPFEGEGGGGGER